MKINELLEAAASDDELRARYGDFEPEDKPMLPQTHLTKEPGPTMWSCRDVIKNILGADNVTDDEDELESGMYYMYNAGDKGHGQFRATGDTNADAGSVEVRDLDSHAAADVGIAAHEAYHAWAHKKSQGGVYRNEKIVNNLAEKWLRKHLRGPSLHIAIEALTQSRINYGQDYLPSRTPSDKRE